MHTQIACGHDHVLCLLTNGYVLSWGGNKQGQLGTGSREYVCVYVCMYVCMCGCRHSMNTCEYVYGCIHACIHTYIHSIGNKEGQLGTGSREYVCMYVCVAVITV